MSTEGKMKARKFQQSLRVRAALGVALPVLLLLITLSWIHYTRERSLLEQHTRLSASQIGEATLGSLRHVMLEKDETHMGQILQDVGQMENIQRLMLIDLDGQVASDSLASGDQQQFDTTDLGCQECHQLAPEAREHATILESQPTILRISTPIDNEPACQACHAATNYLGMLLIDVSLVDTRARLLRDLTVDLLISVGFTMLITVGAYFLMHSLIVKRVESLEAPLAAMAAGNFDVRLPSPEHSRDELDALTHNVNRMADDLERYVDEREQLHKSRYQAMLEERERIAREMHDGVAQLMGYVHTKANAIRLLIKDNKNDSAIQHLEQLSSASQEGTMDIRASILGLRARDLSNDGIHEILRTFLQKFNELTGVEITSELPQADDEIRLSPENELHILRITQEALTNIHKHSGSMEAFVGLRRTNGQIELRIRDQGEGFNDDSKSWNGEFSYGLKSMRERAQAMGATLDVHTQPQQGTEIIVRIPQESV